MHKRGRSDFPNAATAEQVNTFESPLAKRFNKLKQATKQRKQLSTAMTSPNGEMISNSPPVQSLHYVASQEGTAENMKLIVSVPSAAATSNDMLVQ